MDFLSDLLASLPGDLPVRSIHIGVHWTIVQLDSGPNGEPARSGIAKTILPVEGAGHSHTHESGNVLQAGDLQERSAHSLAGLTRSPSGMERGVGWAAVNALLPPDESLCVELNAREFLVEHGRGKNVAMVGHFPFVNKLRDAAKELWVLELNPAPGDLPAEAASDYIPRADVVAITSLTLVNNTFAGLAALWRPEATIMMLGPSTPFTPLLFDRGVNVLSGTNIVDPELAIRTVCQGATFQQVRGVQLLTMTRS